MSNMRLSIHQTMGQIGIQTQWASQTMHSSLGSLSIEQPAADMQMESPRGELSVDSSAAWDALGKGSNLAWSSRIYSQSKDIVLQSIARTAAEGKRMSDLTNPANPFAAIARDRALADSPSVSYTGPAGYSNVELHYEAQKPDIQITPRKPVISYTPVKPDVQYNPGSVDVYIRQKNTIDIQVSNYDLFS